MPRAARLRPWLAASLAVAAAACVAEAPPPRAEVRAAPPVAAEPAALAPVDGETLKCVDLACSLRSVTEADAAQLGARPQRDQIELRFDGASDRDFASIARVPWVTRVTVAGAHGLPDLAPLTNLPGLRRLVITCARCLKSVPALGALSQLEELVIDSAFDELDVTALPPLPKLRVLTLQSMRLRGLEGLWRYPALQVLGVPISNAVDPGPLRKLAAVESLHAYAMKAPEYSWLSGMTALTDLELTSSSLADLSPLEGLTKLQRLDVAWTRAIPDLGPLKGMVQLKALNVDQSLVSDLGPLAGMRALEQLRISQTRVKSLAPLAKLTSLRELDASATEVSDLAPLAHLDRLASLELSQTAVRSVRPLLGAKALRRLKVPKEVPQAELHELKRALPDLVIALDD